MFFTIVTDKLYRSPSLKEMSGMNKIIGGEEKTLFYRINIIDEVVSTVII